jgi:hypothetical protein
MTMKSQEVVQVLGQVPNQAQIPEKSTKRKSEINGDIMKKLTK